MSKLSLFTAVGAVVIAVCVWKLIHLVIVAVLVGAATGIFFYRKLR